MGFRDTIKAIIAAVGSAITTVARPIIQLTGLPFLQQESLVDAPLEDVIQAITDAPRPQPNSGQFDLIDPNRPIPISLHYFDHNISLTRNYYYTVQIELLGVGIPEDERIIFRSVSSNVRLAKYDAENIAGILNLGTSPPGFIFEDSEATLIQAYARNELRPTEL